MKHLIPILTMTLLAAGAAQAGEEVRLRYDGVSARMSLSMNQDIGNDGANF